jgi:hypothetical protein
MKKETRGIPAVNPDKVDAGWKPIDSAAGMSDEIVGTMQQRSGLVADESKHPADLFKNVAGQLKSSTHKIGTLEHQFRKEKTKTPQGPQVKSASARTHSLKTRRGG